MLDRPYNAFVKRAAISLALLGLALMAHGQLFPARPDSTYVADAAHVLSAEDSAAITKESQSLLKATGAPIVVATVKSLSAVDASELGIERYARRMFDNWHIGSKASNRGILIVLAREDHKARIEFGKTWAHKYDRQAQSIMQSIMIPQFRGGHYSKGLTDGVHALVALAKGIKATKSGQIAAVSPPFGAQTDISHNYTSGSTSFYPSENPSFNSPFEPPSGTGSFGPGLLFLVPLACLGLPFIAFIALISSAFNRRRRGYGGQSDWDPNSNTPPPFSPLDQHHHHHHHHNHSSFGIDNSSSSSSPDSSSSGGFDSGSSGGGGSTGSW